jgi:hypothetical protein
MGEDRRKDEAAEETDETTDRRNFLKQAGMIGGGALAAIAGLASAADAQYDIRTGPQGRMGNIELPGPMPPIKARNVPTMERYKNFFEVAKEFVQPEGLKDVQPKVIEAMADMSPSGKVAGITILQMRQRFKESPNVGQNLVVMFNTIGAGIEELEGSGIDPRALGNGCGDGCGSGCGTGCMSPVAGGFGCGNGCGNNCNGVEAAGLMCGGGCGATGLEQLSFDRGRNYLEGVQMKSLDMQTMAAAMRNADRAYNEVFDR